MNAGLLFASHFPIAACDMWRREAHVSSMPTHGIVHDDVDAVFTIRQIGEALTALARGNAVPSTAEDLAGASEAI